MLSLPKYAIRILAFLVKELSEVYRQPRLLLSLTVGPFVVLLLFGAGYRGDRPLLRTALVLPPAVQAQIAPADLEAILQGNFQLEGIYEDAAEPLARLQRGELDVVEIFPADVQAQVLQGNRSYVDFHYNTANPMHEQWVQYLAYAQVRELNRILLLDATRAAQAEAAQAGALLRDARGNLERFQGGLGLAQQADVRETVGQLGVALDILEQNPLLLREVEERVAGVAGLRRQFALLRSDTRLLLDALDANDIDQQRQRLTTTKERVDWLDGQIGQLSALPAEVIVSPLQQTYQNVRGPSLDMMTFYAPGVLMLIVQHIAVTLGALSLVRERMLGSFELYQVAPVSAAQVIAGKYLSYVLFILTSAALLVGLLVWGLGVPFLGSGVQFAALLLLFTLAALGVGFGISLLSGSDSQAVQLSMLVLLISVFFGGFFLPVENFRAPLRLLSYGLPLTHGVASARAVLLQGLPVAGFAWLCLLAIAGLTLGVVLLLARWQFARAR